MYRIQVKHIVNINKTFKKYTYIYIYDDCYYYC